MECLKAVITENVGYEARLASIDYSLESVDDMGVRIKTSGYSDKIFDFTKILLDMVFECAKAGAFPKSTVMNAMTVVRAECQNSNDDAEARAANNRLLFLLPHTYHDGILADLLGEEIEKLSEADQDALTEFEPSKFLKERILSKIAAVQTLVFGNTTKEQAVKFCQENVAYRFRIVRSNIEGGMPLEIGSVAQLRRGPKEAVATLGNLEQTRHQQINPLPVDQLIWDCAAPESNEEEEQGE